MPTIPDSECKSWLPNVLEPWPLASLWELAPGYGEDIPRDERDLAGVGVGGVQRRAVKARLDMVAPHP